MASNTSTNAKNVVSHKDDLRKAYMFIFETHPSATPSEFAANTSGVNLRFARELFATLVDQQLVVTDDANGDDVWQVTNPGTIEEVTREEAESRFDEVIGGGKPSATTPKKAKSKELKDCLCGCGDQTQSMFKPGHDARYAGQIGRAMAEHPVGSNPEQAELAKLPTDALKTKALGIATTVREKASKKVANAAAKEAAKAAKANEQPDPEEGTIKASKKEFAARRFADGTVEALRDGEWKPATPAQTKTFKVG